MSQNLNQKIERIIEELGYTNSKFADEIQVKRPIISHIIAERNKPSLEVIQKILQRFPELGIEWTYEGNELDYAVLNKIASHDLTREGQNTSLVSTFELSDSSKKNLNLQSIEKITVFRSGNSFTDFSVKEAPLRSKSNISEERNISKIVVFFDDNSFSEYTEK